MIDHYESYYWKAGRPCGERLVDSNWSQSYKIVVDPYCKRYSIENYREGRFHQIVYDSIFLDFRHLNSTSQIAWQRELIEEKNNQASYLIRDQEDRAILIETQFFEKNWCRRCEIRSIHRLLISTHHMRYQAFNDSFNGVALYDQANQPVMIKTYDIDQETGEFSNLLTEEWDMRQPPLFMRGAL